MILVSEVVPSFSDLASRFELDSGLDETRVVPVVFANEAYL